MFVDADSIDETQYLLLMLVLNLSAVGRQEITLHSLLKELQTIVPEDEANEALDKAEQASLIGITTEEGRRRVYERQPSDHVHLSFSGMAVLINFPNRFLAGISERFGEIPENLTATLIPYLNLERVPAADRYVSTTDNQSEFKRLSENLETIKLEIIKDQNSNELPIKQKRAVIAELGGLVAQIRGGFVKLSDLTNRARPLLRGIADVCKDITVIAVAASAALAAIHNILQTLFH
jgi:hypothetical protein